jgi:hypothetical protein
LNVSVALTGRNHSRTELCAILRTLCIDGGKKHHRDLLLCASNVRGAFVVRVKREGSFPVDESGPFCNANIGSAIKEVIADLALAGCAVANVCADNASDMQAARSDEYTTLRCAAHVIQLVVTGCVNHLNLSFG